MNMPQQPKTQKQSTELILYRLDELTSTTKDSFDKMATKLDNMNSTYVPREEIMLYRAETVKQLQQHSTTLDLHAQILQALQKTDDFQQGAIDSKKSTSNLTIAILSAIGALIGGLATAGLILQGLHK
jgi:hypothetical protein